MHLLLEGVNTVNGSGQGNTLTISAIDELGLSGSVSTLNITTTTGGAGTGLQSVSSSGLSYYFTTNGTARVLKANISSALPSGLSLTASATAPAGGTSLGAVTLSTTNANLVTGIAKQAVASTSALGITFTLVPTAMVSYLTSGSTTANFTLGP